MAIATLLSNMAIIMSLVLFCMGWPVQIYKNAKRKSVEGLSRPLFALSLLANAVWLWYGIRTNIPLLIIPNIPGVFFGTILIMQFVIYKKGPVASSQ
jgi:uncharacterized protein with PQ loop repeat